MTQALRCAPGLMAVVFMLLARSPASPAGQPATQNLPKVVLLGDSLRLSYAPLVAKQLVGKATIVSPAANGGDSSRLLSQLEKWAIQEQPALIHFNCGIHDIKKFKTSGKFQVSPEQYEANLRRIVERLRKETKAQVVFGLTTPVLDDRAARARADKDYELLAASVEQYNEIAKRVMQELKVPINDLHGPLAKPDPPTTSADLLGDDGVHLTPAGRDLLAKTVAECIDQQLLGGK